MISVFIQHEFIEPNAVEFREYQINIAASAGKKNTLVVLPTGLGKTIIALYLIAKKLKKKNKKILFLAPTKPLVNQHAQTLQNLLTIPESDIVSFTGEISPDTRKNLWNDSRIIISTPQVIENDLLNRCINLDDVSFLIFDEAHHATGKYAYVFIAEMYRKQSSDQHVLGITASPGKKMDNILEVCSNLYIENVEIRTKYDTDVKPYIHELHISWKHVSVPDDFSYAIKLFKKALQNRLQFLKDLEVIESASVSKISKKKLIDAQKVIQGEIKARNNPPKALFKAAAVQSESLKLLYGLELLETQGVESVNRYFRRIRKEARTKTGSKSAKNLMTDTTVLEILAYLHSIHVEHPKLPAVKNIVQQQLQNNPDSRIIVFTHFRDTAAMVTDQLSQLQNAQPVRFVGQSGKEEDKGLTQKQQNEIVTSFKKGKYNVLIATSVAEEGLDIPSTDLVVFYEPIPSEIRNIQRRGRTARKMPGSIIILITKGTADEGYFWAAKRREKQMRTDLELLRSKLKRKFETAQSIQQKKERKTQQTLREYESNQNMVNITVDHREYRSSVVRALAQKGVVVTSDKLDVADYVVSSRIGIERKQVDDFLNSLINRKLFRQVKQLRNAYPRPILVIEGKGLFTKRNINHHAIFGCFISIIVDYGVSIISTDGPSDTADLLFVTAKREQRKKNKDLVVRGDKPAMSLSQQQRFIIEGFPLVSSVIAKRLLFHFKSIRAIMTASEQELQEVPGVGKKIAAAIVEMVNTDYAEE